MNKNDFIKALKELNIEIDAIKLDLVDKYIDFLLEYNEHTNLTAINRKEDIYLKHFYDSLTITKVVDLNKINTLLDIGSGAGFPGMVLKIFFPHISVTLIDSNNKKTKFLEELSNILKLDIEIINDRVENYSKNNLNKYDLVTARAVANLRVLSELTLPLVKNNGLFISLKGKIDEELNDALDTINIMGGKVDKISNFLLYENNGTRNILVINKIRNTFIEEVRNYDKIVKKPLKK